MSVVVARNRTKRNSRKQKSCSASQIHSDRDSFISYSPTARRMTNTVRSSNTHAILSVGEELRQLLHAEKPPLIKDRRYHLRTFEKCFTGLEMVDWLLKKGEVESRREAVAMMQKLLEHEVIHHVCDDHNFKDEKLFYRFRRDDGTYEEPPDSAAIAKGQRIYSRLRTDGSNLIQDRKYHLSSYKQCFIGRELVDWLITRGEVNTREEAVELGMQLLDAGVFRHVCDDHHFRDEFLYFRFKNDEKPSKSLSKRVGVGSKRGNKRSSGTGVPTGSGDDISVGRGSLASTESSEGLGASGEPRDDDYVPMQSPNEASNDPGYVQMQRPSESHSPSSGQPSPLPTRSVNDKPTLEELLDPNLFTQKQVEVVSDPVGYGFVIRGAHPVYVHNVDPSGPAAAAGVHVGEYLHYVNGDYVLEKSHTDVARIILMGPSTASLVILSPKDNLAR